MQTLLIAVTSRNNLTLRGTASLERTLDSIRTARETLLREAPVRVALSWVDDGSDDGTDRWLARRLKEDRDEWLLHNELNRGAGPARNQAATRIGSDCIAPFDSDDEMYPDHLLAGWLAMGTPDASGRLPGWASSLCDFGDCDGIHPEWRRRISNSSPCTKLFRRRVWDFVEGFPEAAIYRTTGEEDCDLMSAVATFFMPIHIDRPTMRYWNYPDSHLDRQLPRFRQAPRGARPDAAPPRHQAAYRLRDWFQDQRIRYLKFKLEHLTDPGEFDDLATHFRFEAATAKPGT